MIYDFEVVDYPMTYSFWSTDLKLIPFNNLEKKSSLNYGFFGQKKALSSLASTRDVLPFLVPFIIYVSLLIPATDQNIPGRCTCCKLILSYPKQHFRVQIHYIDITTSTNLVEHSKTKDPLFLSSNGSSGCFFPHC